jgi:hypothetical protein
METMKIVLMSKQNHSSSSNVIKIQKLNVKMAKEVTLLTLPKSSTYRELFPFPDSEEKSL